MKGQVAGTIFAIIIFLIMIALPFLFQNMAYSTENAGVVNQFDEFFQLIGWPFWILISAGVAVGSYLGMKKVSG